MAAPDPASRPVTHTRPPGTYVVTLTISDGYGRTATTSQTITVAGGVNPTAVFTSSPSDPLVNQPVNFNASGSRAAPGRTIASYEWDFGDGTFGQGVIDVTLLRAGSVVHRGADGDRRLRQEGHRDRYGER